MRAAVWIGCVCVSLLACGGNSKGADDGGGHGGTHGRDAGHADAGAPHDAANDAGPGFDAGSDPGRNQAQPGAVCARLAAIECAGEAACCGAGARDPASCSQELEQTCKTMLLLDDVSAADSVAFDPDRASMAFLELEQRASVCDPSVAAWAVSTDGFLASIGGTLVKGENCEPKGGLSAPPADLAIALVSCQLAAGVACLPSADGWTCESRVGPAGRCFVDLNCADGLFCDNPMSSFDGTCAQRKPAGGGCRSATECTSFICKDAKCAAENDVQAAYCP